MIRNASSIIFQCRLRYENISIHIYTQVARIEKIMNVAPKQNSVIF